MSNNNNLPANSGQNNNLSNINSAKNLFGIRKTVLKSTQYSQRVTSTNPCAFVLLVDQSGSMDKRIEDNKGNLLSKAQHLALMVNKFLDEILTTCQKSDGIKDYFEIIIIGYGQLNENGESIAKIAWEGKLKDKTWVTVNELKNGALRTEIIKKPNPSKFGRRELEEPVNIWLEPKAEDGTPMQQAFNLCDELLQDWVRNHPDSFPPIVFNITDGMASDVDDISEIVEISSKLKNIATNDGNVLLFNCLISENNENLKEFPLTSERLLFENDEHELALFDASSPIPENLKKLLPTLHQSEEENRGLVLNATIESIIRFLNIGTYTLKSISN